MPKKGTLFLNRSSGLKVLAADVEDLVRAATDAGLEVLETGEEVDVALAIRERIARGVRFFIAAGGDGTIHHVVQALVNSEAELGVIPIGTYNHFARDLGIPLPWREALDTALTGELIQIDTARVNDRFFINNVSIGLYPEVVARREERGRDYPRWKARLYAIAATLRKYPHVTLTVESAHHREAIRTHLFMVSNNHYDLEQIGIEAFRPNMGEGRLSVYWLPHISRIQLMRFVARYLAGRVRETPGYRSFRTTQLQVHSARHHLKIGIDGEVFAMPIPLTITTVPQSLSVRVPRK